MSGAAEILVIILSVVLAIFLILGIVLTILLIKISKQIKDVTGSAKRTAEHIESTAAGFSRLTSPFFLAKLVGKQVKKFRSKK